MRQLDWMVRSELLSQHSLSLPARLYLMSWYGRVGCVERLPQRIGLGLPAPFWAPDAEGEGAAGAGDTGGMSTSSAASADPPSVVAIALASRGVRLHRRYAPAGRRGVKVRGAR